MSSAAAFRDGLRRVNGAPLLVLGTTGVTLLVALPLALTLRGMLEAHLGRSLEAEAAASATNYAWWQEFQSQAAGLGTTFTPSITGFGAVLDNLTGLLDNLPLATTIAGVTAAWLLVWSFLSGGLIDRLARGRPTRSHGFFTACGIHFWRFVRIGAAAWLVYYFLFGWVHGWIFDDLFTRWTRDLTVERTAFALRVAGYVLFGALLAACSLAFDYARIRAVVEDRRSALGSIVAGLRFIRRHPGSVTSLYLLNGAAFVLLAVLYAIVVPGAPGEGLGMWAVLLTGQLYILMRHYLKLVFYASQTALFQSRLAHAAFAAPPPVVWPESPAAESLANADIVGR